VNFLLPGTGPSVRNKPLKSRDLEVNEVSKGKDPSPLDDRILLPVASSPIPVLTTRAPTTTIMTTKMAPTVPSLSETTAGPTIPATTVRSTTPAPLVMRFEMARIPVTTAGPESTSKFLTTTETMKTTTAAPEEVTTTKVPTTVSPTTTTTTTRVPTTVSTTNSPATMSPTSASRIPVMVTSVPNLVSAVSIDPYFLKLKSAIVTPFVSTTLSPVGSTTFQSNTIKPEVQIVRITPKYEKDEIPCEPIIVTVEKWLPSKTVTSTVTAIVTSFVEIPVEIPIEVPIEVLVERVVTITPNCTECSECVVTEHVCSTASINDEVFTEVPATEFINCSFMQDLPTSVTMPNPTISSPKIELKATAPVSTVVVVFFSILGGIFFSAFGYSLLISIRRCYIRHQLRQIWSERIPVGERTEISAVQVDSPVPRSRIRFGCRSLIRRKLNSKSTASRMTRVSSKADIPTSSSLRGKWRSSDLKVVTPKIGSLEWDHQGDVLYDRYSSGSDEEEVVYDARAIQPVNADIELEPVASTSKLVQVQLHSDGGGDRLVR